MLLLYNNRCGYSKRLAPEYEKAAKQLNESGGMPLGKVDATRNKRVAKKYGVGEYPTLKFFHNGKAEEYKGNTF